MINLVSTGFVFLPGTHWADVVAGKRSGDAQTSPTMFGFAPVVHPAYNYSPSHVPSQRSPASPGSGFAAKERGMRKSPSMPASQYSFHVPRSSQSESNFQNEADETVQLESRANKSPDNPSDMRSRSSSRDGPIQVSFHLDSDDPGFASNSSDSGKASGKSPQSYAEACQHCHLPLQLDRRALGEPSTPQERTGRPDNVQSAASHRNPGNYDGTSRGKQKPRHYPHRRHSGQDHRQKSHEATPSSDSGGATGKRVFHERGRPSKRGHRGHGRGHWDRDHEGKDRQYHGNYDGYGRSRSDSGGQPHTGNRAFKSHSSPHSFVRSGSTTGSMEGRAATATATRDSDKKTDQ